VCRCIGSFGRPPLHKTTTRPKRFNRRQGNPFTSLLWLPTWLLLCPSGSTILSSSLLLFCMSCTHAHTHTRTYTHAHTHTQHATECEPGNAMRTNDTGRRAGKEAVCHCAQGFCRAHPNNQLMVLQPCRRAGMLKLAEHDGNRYLGAHTHTDTQTHTEFF
jgi:hypothetical protein